MGDAYLLDPHRITVLRGINSEVLNGPCLLARSALYYSCCIKSTWEVQELLYSTQYNRRSPVGSDPTPTPKITPICSSGNRKSTINIKESILRCFLLLVSALLLINFTIIFIILFSLIVLMLLILLLLLLLHFRNHQ